MKTSSLGFTDGMLYGMGRTAPGGPKVLDWERAAELCAKSDVPVYAGLAEDWSCTSGMIWDGEKQVRDYVFVWSSWATPVLVVGDDSDDGTECFRAATQDDPSGYPKWWGKEADHD